jgi:hypothetical protein
MILDDYRSKDRGIELSVQRADHLEQKFAEALFTAYEQGKQAEKLDARLRGGDL